MFDPNATGADLCDEMGRDVEKRECWYVHASFVGSGVDGFPAISGSASHAHALQLAEQRRRELDNWVCVYITGPHEYWTPAKTQREWHPGPRKGRWSDIGLAELDK